MYKIARKIKKGTLKNKINFDGLLINIRKNKKTLEIKNVTIVDKKLKNYYAIKQMNKSLKKVYDKIYLFLESDDDSASGIKACLGEIEKCKETLFRKYKEELKIKKYKEYIAKIALVETIFKDKYYEREFYNNFINNMYKQMNFNNEEELRGKSR